MKEQDIKETLSKILYGISDAGIENIVREIVFDKENHINWNNVMDIIKKHRPEIK